ncbi:MAG TPA: GPP34 family phosphoprotein, partial [Micromonosporaceae bacterium]|nr:GPP34 family phosphoprotein [Micromonosporaceae bacterium]
ETGRIHIDLWRLARGLAAAVLFELWLAGRINIGWRFNAREGRAVKESGLVTVMSPAPIGDPLSDNLLTTLWNTGGTLKASDVIDQFAETDLYERVRADMIAAGVLRRTTRKRFRFFRTEAYQPSHKAYPVRARSMVRDLVDNYRRNHDMQLDRRALALSALVTALGLNRRLFVQRDSADSEFHRWLHYIVEQQIEPTIRDVVAAVTRR